MSRKKAATQAVRASNPPLPAWVWLTAGFALGVLVSAVLIFRDWNSDRQAAGTARPGTTTQPVAAADTGIVAPGTVAPAATDPAKPKYEFYTVLQEREVEIPEAELRTQAQQPTPATEPGARYWLQVGSFPKPAEADGLKARLALLGIKVQVAPVTIDGTVWHRVRTGPYGDAKQLEEARSNLQANDFKAFAYKEKT